MSLILLSLAQQALAGSGAPFAVGAGANLVFQGEVVGVSECVSTDGAQVWSFVQFEVEHTLAGTAVPHGNEAADRFTVRVPAGTHADGSRSAVAGMPIFAVGDKFIVPVHAPNGTPGFLPFLLHGDGGYYRVFEDAGGGAVVTGDGRMLVQSSRGNPVPGVWVRPARHVEPGNVTVGIDHTAVLDALASYRTTVGYDGTNPPTGTWEGRLRVKATTPVQTTSWGTYETATDCNAPLFGTYDGTDLTLTGSCNTRYLGKVDVTVTGSRNANGYWSGALRLSAGFDSTIAGEFAWHDQPWSSAHDFPDAFTAHTTDFRVADSVDSEYEDDFTLGEDPERNVEFMAAWKGRRAEMSVADFRTWLTWAASHVGAGRTVYSVENAPANCPSVPVQAL